MPRVSQLTEEKKQELLKLLADSNIDWLEVFKNFPGFNKIQLTNFAKKQKVNVSNKEKNTPEYMCYNNIRTPINDHYIIFFFDNFHKFRY